MAASSFLKPESLIRLLAPAACALLASACAVSPAGEDPKGAELKAQGRPVLAALVSYRKDKGEYPQSLHELVPRYLNVVPFAVNLNLNHHQKRVEFVYETAWPQSQPVACLAAFGELDWTCQPI
jgi:hypothetical protein